MKLEGLKKAVGEYQRANKGGYYSPEYGYLMLDRATGEVWTDYFNSIGHNSWKEYEDASIINLGKIIESREEKVTMETVKAYALDEIRKYEEV